MRRTPSLLLIGLTFGVLYASETIAGAQEAPTVEERLAAQEARIKELEQKLSQPPPTVARTVAPPPALPSTPSVALAPTLTPPAAPVVPLFGFGWNDGVWIGRPDVVQFRLRALVQADARLYFDTAKTPLPDQFVMRRVRPIIEGTFFDFADFRIVPDFGGGNAVVQDAYVDLRPFPYLALRAGKFKTPLGLERLQNDAFLMVLERGLPTNLVPDRDIGASLHGDLGGGILLYELAIMNGAPDGANVDSDPNDGKDGIARVFFHPLRPLKRDLVRNLGIGIGASYGKQHGSATATSLPSYRSFGQNVFFSYAFDATGAKAQTIAIGDRYRVAPQLYWFVGPVGLLAEYTYAATTVTGNLGTLDPKVTLANQAWQLEANVFVTGEKSSYGGPKVKRPFSLRQRHFGALELDARYGELRIDAAAFPTYADPAKSARSALEWVLGFNWYLTDGIKIAGSFARTTFSGGAGMGDRRPENALVLRVQLYF